MNKLDLCHIFVSYILYILIKSIIGLHSTDRTKPYSNNLIAFIKHLNLEPAFFNVKGNRWDFGVLFFQKILLIKRLTTDTVAPLGIRTSSFSPILYN